MDVSWGGGVRPLLHRSFTASKSFRGGQFVIPPYVDMKLNTTCLSSFKNICYCVGFLSLTAFLPSNLIRFSVMAVNVLTSTNDD